MLGPIIERGISSGGAWRVSWDRAHVFPPKCRATLDTVDVSNGVVSGSHLAVVGFALDNVNTVEDA